MKNHLSKEGFIGKEDALIIIEKTKQILSIEPNLLDLNDPITLVGDIHGQYYDLLKLFDIGGCPSKVQYLFLGDYVDRGSFSVEVVLLLYSIKINFPNTFWLLRGNHETRNMTSFFNFKNECLLKFDEEVYDKFMESFDYLPICAIVNKNFFVLHGGISPELITLDQIRDLDRIKEPPKHGLLCDLLWADPSIELDSNSSNDVTANDSFYPNQVRGCSYTFGSKAVDNFLVNNKLLGIVRAHEAQLDGFKMHKKNLKTGLPMVITIFSAPNYCDVYNNKGALLKLHENTLNIQQFSASPHPYHLPNFMNIFSWSLPFVSEKVLEMLYGLIQQPKWDLKTWAKTRKQRNGLDELPAEARELVEEIQPETIQLDPIFSKERAEAIRAKVQTIGRLMRLFKTLRMESELVVQLKDCNPGHRIPLDLLLSGRQGLENALENFNAAKTIDLKNECWPENKTTED